MPYIGRTLGQGTRSRFLYTATAGQTTFSGSDTQSNTLAYADNNGLDCFQNGVLLKGGGADYTATTGTSVVLTTGASVSDVIEILVYDVFAIADHVKKSGDTITGQLNANGGAVFNEDSADVDFRVESNGQTNAIFVNAGDDITNFFSTTTVNSAGSNTDDGLSIRSDGRTDISRASGQPLNLRRRTDDGSFIAFYKEESGSTDNIGSIGIAPTTNDLFITSASSGHKGLRFGNGAIVPVDNSANNSDNNTDLGGGTIRFDDIYATNGTIQTSDQNEKQDIASATTKELNVAKKLSALFKTFKWKDKVAEKGDKARTHTGIIAQEVQSAVSSEGLDASNYGLFTSDTWTNDDGKEQTRLGVRYPELFSFIFSSIEARLTALEGK